jgi:DNA modification methylase
VKIETLPLSAVIPDPANARVHDERNLDAIRGSLARFGQQKPIVVDSAGVIRAGNGTYMAAKLLGWQTIEVVRTTLAGLDAAAFAIADNRTSDLSAFDDRALATLLEQLRAEDALAGVGFEEAEIQTLLRDLEAQLGASELADPGPGEPPANPVTRLGDLWVLGDHRLLCGDSTKREDVARLMAGDRSQLLATDPPYLVDYEAERWDEFKDAASGVAFYRAFLEVALEHCATDVVVWQWHAHRRQALVEEAWKAAGLLVHQQVIWAKSRGVLSRSWLMWAHEPAFLGWREGKMPAKPRRPPSNATTVWQISQADEPKGLHPTTKPREIFERPIEWHTRRGEVCLEPFSGSGTQIVAAERLGRRCFAMELSPAFVDVAIVRWQQATGKSAVLEGDQCPTFEELARERGVELPPAGAKTRREAV